MTASDIIFEVTQPLNPLCVSLLQALQHGFLDFEHFNVDDYEHYEVTFFHYIADINTAKRKKEN